MTTLCAMPLTANAHVVATGATRSGAPAQASVGRESRGWALTYNGLPKHMTAQPVVRDTWLRMLDPKQAPAGKVLSSAWSVVEVSWRPA